MTHLPSYRIPDRTSQPENARRVLQDAVAESGLQPLIARFSSLTLATLLLALSACTALSGVFTPAERPPLPLVQAEISSDARVDSTGAIAGSFVGEGTSRQVHLLSSDPAFIAELVRRWRPEKDRRIDPVDWLNKRGTYAINLDRNADSALLNEVMLTGSPDGHTRVKLSTILLNGAKCRNAGPQAELIVEPSRSARVSLRGPVVGSFRSADVKWPVSDNYSRDPIADPSDELVDSLIERTAQVMDSVIQSRLPTRELPLRDEHRRLAINSLADEDAADVIPVRLDDGRIRYAVSLRETRRTARGAEAMASIVMIWDATLTWRQIVFLPTLLELGRRGPTRPLGERGAPYYWRRLQTVSGFAFERDYVWMEQVNVRDGSVRWVILEPRGNIVVAAADVEDGC